MDDKVEICGGCALERMCHANGKPPTSAGDGACSASLRRKASWLMFWIPLIILTAGLFLMVGALRWNDLLSFVAVAGILTLYYTILKLKLK